MAAGPAGSDRTAIVLSGILTLVGVLLSAFAVYRASAAATKVNEKVQLSESQLKWTQQAMSEATSAKADSEQARASAKAAEAAARVAERVSGETMERAIAAEERLASVESISRSLLVWIERIMSAAADDSIPDIEVRRMINNGPADLNRAKVRLRTAYPHS